MTPHTTTWCWRSGTPALRSTRTPTGRIFGPFQRARSRIASDRSGHGFGLALVYPVAHANPDGGLTVRVEFPGHDRD
ncbi:hypothetical protein [Streptomyces sp. NPDC020480]|uniref:hypothetical protein n=1 Tax=Streptomyces sp. NPDC020480 TaxID=3365076 RepID=UPI0037B04AA5